MDSIITNIHSPTQWELVEFFKKNTPVQLYLFAGMDSVFKDNSHWNALYKNGEIKELSLYRSKGTNPHLYFLSRDNSDETKKFLTDAIKDIKGEFYIYISSHFSNIFDKINTIEDHGNYFQMYLQNRNLLTCENKNIRRLGMNHLPQMMELFDADYPGHWFTPSALENGIYIGHFENDRLVGIAGTNLINKKQGISSIGNIVIRSDFRGKGIAKNITSCLCNILLENNISEIGLSVHTHNSNAIKMYEGIGFSIVDEYVYRKISLNLSESPI